MRLRLLFIATALLLLHLTSYAQAPDITSFSPARGSMGETIMITGTDFTDASAVSFGGTPATSFVVFSQFTIFAVVAAGTSGSVFVQTPLGSDTEAGFTYVLVPTVTSFSPASGPVGTTVTITGTNFNTTIGKDSVFFGATRAVVSTATTTTLEVTVPAGATYKPITVTTSGRTAFSRTSFLPTFTGGQGIVSSTFGPQVDYNTGAQGNNYLAVGDLDADGKADVVAANFGNSSVGILRNTSTTPGTTPTFAALQSISAGSFPGSVAIGDMDGDGRLDIVVTRGNATIAVFRNTTTSVGTITFDALVSIALGVNLTSVAIGDFDGNGKPDLAFVDYGVGGASILRNTSSGAGNISFATKVSFTTEANPRSLSIGDLDGDGKPDLAVACDGGPSAQISVLRNTTSAVGTITFAAKQDYASSQPQQIAIGDISGDGVADLATISFNPQQLQVYHYNGTGPGNISYATSIDLATGGTNPSGLAMSDLDGDGKIDIGVTTNTVISVFRNTNSGSNVISLASAVNLNLAGYKSLVFGDLDSDGKPDLIAANDGATDGVSISRNRGDVTAPSVTLRSPLDNATLVSASSNLVLTFGENVVKGTGNIIIREGGNLTQTIDVTSGTVTISGGVVTIDPSNFTFGAAVNIEIGSGVFKDAYNNDYAGAVNATTWNFAVIPAAPVISSFTPTSAGAGITVTITGTTFTGATAVSFGGTAATSFSVVNATTITAVVAAGTTGSVSVTTPGGNHTLAGFTWVPAPTLDSFTPTSAGPGMTVTLTGSNFTDASIVRFGGTNATSFNVVNSTTIEAVVAAGSSGVVLVTTPGGTITKSGFTWVAAPTLPSFTPTSAAVGMTVTLTGTNFTNASAVSFGGTAATSFNVVSATSITAVVATGTTGSVSVTTPGGTATTTGFTFVPPPTLTSFNPTSTVAGYPLPLTGTNFNTATAVSFGGIAATSFTINSATSITATVPYGGSGTVSVTTIAGTANLAGFTFFNQPTITSFSPESGPVGTAVTITGTDFIATPAFNTVYFGATKAVVTGATTTSLTVTVPAGATFQSISVTTNNMIAYSPRRFTPTFTLGSGIVSGTFATKVDFTIPSTARVVATGDLDRDGKADVVTSSQGSNNISVMRNTSTGTANISFAARQDFSTVVSSVPRGVAIGDLDGDGRMDIAVAKAGGGVSVFRNTSVVGAITLDTRQDFTAGTNPYAVVIGDFDGDGRADLAVTNSNGNSVSILPNTSSGIGNINFGTKIDFTTASGPRYLAIGDLDGDGKPDLAVACETGGQISVFRNTSSGDGSFTFSTKQDFAMTGVGSVAIGDLNGNGTADLAGVSFSGSAGAVFRFNGTVGTISYATAVAVTTGSNPTTVSIGDLDGDGMNDLAVTGQSIVSVFRNTTVAGGNPAISVAAGVSFATVTNPSLTAISDMDNDGKSDLVVSTEFDALCVLRNKGDVIAPLLGIKTPSDNATVVAATSNLVLDFTENMAKGTGNIIIREDEELVQAINVTSAAVSISGTIVTIDPANFTLGANVNIEIAPGVFTDAVGNEYGGISDATEWNFAVIPPAPTISSFTPTSAGAGMIVTITGTTFTGASAVSFGGTAATSFTVVSPASITAEVAAGTSGSASVTTPGGTGTKTGFTFVPAPTLASFAPTSAGAGTTVTLTGTNFTGATAVSFGGTAATSFTVVSPTSITAVVASGTSGSVSVTTPGGTITLAGFTFIPAPTLSSFTPTTAATGATVTLTGTNFTDASAVSFGGTAATSFNIVSPTSITAVVASGTSGSASVTTPGGNVTLAGFTFIPAPTLSSFTPTSAGSGTTVTLTGTNFTGATTVSFGGTAAASFTIVSPTSITAVVASGTSGSVSVTTPGGTATLAGFTFIPAPTLASFTPTAGGPGSTVTLTGTNFSGATAVSFAGIPANVFQVISPTSIMADVPYGGSGSISVATPGGSISLAGFMVPDEPVITAISPESGPVGTIVTITGTGFGPGNVAVYFGATKVTTFTTSTTSFDVNVPAGATFGPISVLANGMTAYSPKPFLPTFTGGAVIDATTFATKVDFAVGFVPYFVAVGDLDGDGKADVVVTNTAGSNIGVFRNTSTGTGNTSFATREDFATVTGTTVNEVAIGDLDGDGKQDVVVTNSNGNVSVLRNTSTGPGSISFATRVTFTAGSNPFGIVIGDLDGDGRPDVVVANTVSNNVSIFRSTSSGPGSINFATKVDIAVPNEPVQLGIGDLDGDGKQDLAIGRYDALNVSVLRNTSSGDGNFSFATRQDFPGGPTWNIKIGDLNADGTSDLAVIKGISSTGGVLRYNGTGPGNISYDARAAFSSTATVPSPISMAAGDLNGDGKMDIALADDIMDGIFVFRNTTSTGANPLVSVTAGVMFTTAENPYDMEIADMDGDGKSDLLVISSLGQLSVLLNNGDPNAPTVASFAPSDDATLVAASSNLELTFSEDVVKGTGDILVSQDGQGTQLIAVTSAAVTINGAVVTINPTDFTKGTVVDIQIPSGAFKDKAGNNYGGIAGATTWNFNVIPPVPTVSGIDPGSAAGGATVTLTGTGLTGATALSFGGIAATSFTVLSATSIEAVLPAAPAGDISNLTESDVSVTTTGGTGTLVAGFVFIPLPTITSFSPSSAGPGMTVLLTGTNFYEVTALSFGGTSAIDGGPISLTQFTGVVGAGTSGDVSITAIGGTATLPGFTWVPTPVVDSFSPASAATGETVTILGYNFSNATEVSFGDVAAASFTVDSPSAISAVVASGSSGDVKVSTPGGTSTSSGFTYLPPPTITSFSPTSAGPGMYVTITGTNFNSISALTFGGTSVIEVNIISSTELIVLLGDGSTGDVTITTTHGSATLPGFTFVPSPTLTSFDLSTAAAGATVTLTGTNFTAATTVSFGGTAAASVNVISSTSITAVVASGSSGSVSITTEGGTATLTGFTFIPAPTLTSFGPTNTGPGSTVYLTGENFTDATAVSFGGTAAASFNVDTPTGITAVVGPGSSGSVSVTTLGGTATLTGFTFVPAPTLTAIDLAIAGPGMTITLTGTNFTGAFDVEFGGSIATSFTVVSDTKITAVVASGTSGSVSVTTPGGTASLAGFTFIPAPTLASFDPTSAGAGVMVTLTGTNFTGATAVSFGGTATNSFTVDSPTSITAVVSSGASGSVSVTTPGGTTAMAGFTFIPAPTLASFNPTSAAIEATVTLTGTNFTGATAVSFGGTAATSFTVDSPTSITAVVASGTSGSVSVTTPGGTATKTGFNFIPAPVLTSFTPTSAGGGMTVTLTGTDFTDATSVSFGGTAATSFTVVSATSITAVVASGASGSISVTTPGGTTTLTGFNFVLAPTLTSFDLANAGPGMTVTLTGTNFTGATAVSFGGTAATSFIVVSASSITAVVASGTSGSVSVTTPGGTTSLAGFTFVPAPTLTSFDLASAGPGMTVTLTGTNFTGATDVRFGANAAASFNVISPTIITAVVATGASGSIWVTTAGGTASVAGFIFVPAPILTSFTPTSAGGGMTVTLTGIEFTDATAVSLGGTAATSFNVDSPTSITAVVSSGSSGDVSVTTPGGTTTMAGFTFIPAPTLTAFNPTTARTGVTVTLTGTNFTGATAVTIGGTAAASFNVVSPTSITAVLASGSSGTVSVTTGGGQAGLSGFTFVPPTTITNINPNSGFVGTSVTVTGTSFNTTAANNTVKFNGVTATITGTPTTTSIVTTVPAGATTGTITVETDGETATSSTNFTVTLPDAPIVTGFSPTVGPIGTTVTITGANFSTTASNNTVKFNGTEATISGTPTTTSIVTTVPAGATTGTITVEVSGQSAGSSTQYIVANAPAITAFSPESGPVGTVITITGTDFSATLANNTVFFGATKAVVSAATTTSLTVTVPLGATFQPISVFSNGLVAYGRKPFLLTFTGGSGIVAGTFGPRMDFAAGSASQATAVGDLDGDGKTDVVFSNQNDHTISIFRSTSSGSGNTGFATRVDISTGVTSMPSAVVLGDLDGDGKLDVVVARQTGGIAVFRNTSSGSGNIAFASRLDFTVGLTPNWVEIGDFDGDGKTDLVAANSESAGSGSASVSILRGTGSGPGNINFAAKVDFTTAIDPRHVAVGDLDGDGKPDLAVACRSSDKISVLRNTSTGDGNINFAPKLDFSGVQPISVAIGDLNGNGTADLAVANLTANTVSVFRYNGSGAGNISYAAKVDFATGNAPNSVTMGDLDGDGKIDLAVANQNSPAISVLRNTNNGTSAISFAGAVNFATAASQSLAVIGDVDGDGRGDLVVSTYNNFLVILPNNGDVTPPTVTAYSPADNATNVSFSSNLVVTFSEDVIKGTGNIVIREAGNLTQSIAVSSASVTVSGNIVTINPSDFTPGAAVNIEIAPGAFTDFEGNDYAGIADATFWNFEIPAVAPPAPTISSFTPTSVAQGGTVTITGTNFTGTTAVSFGGTPATSFNVVSTTSITAMVAAGASGDVSVTAPGGTVTLGGFTFLPYPTLTSFNPTSAGEGATIALTGTNFTGASAVSFGGTNATSFTVVSPTSITAVVASGSSGSVLITTPGGVATLGGFTFVPSPTLASFNPTTAGAGATVTLTGTNFGPATSVTFGGTAAASFNIVSSTSITAVVGSGSTGTVSVSSPGGIAGLTGFTFAPAPTLTSFTPNSAVTGATVTLTGTNFTAATSVKFGGTAAATFNVVSATSITAEVGSGSSGSVSVTTPGGTASLSGFTFVPTPSITGFTPNSGPIGTSVTITGTNFSTTTINNTVKFNGVLATITGTPTATSIVTTVPSGATTGAITVEVNGLTATSANDFTVTPPNSPTVSGFNPASGLVGTSVTITGTNFSTTAANNTVKFNGTVATITGTPTASSIVATVPTGATTGTISVEVNGQTATSSSNFTVTLPNTPSIASFNPVSGPIGTSVTITGTNFSTTAANNTVKFNGTVATITGTPTATSIVATVPTGATTGTISVEVNGQTATSSSNFTVTLPNTPTIASFNPVSGPIGTSVTITGTNFSTTASDNIVKFNGTVAAITGTPTTTSIVTTVPAGATTGTITVEINGQTATSSSSFTVTAPNSPTITSFNPGSGPIGTSVTITGTNFSTTAANNTVKFNGVIAAITGTPTTTSIVTTVPSGATTGVITVEVGGLTGTSSTQFIVASPPTVSSFNPASGPVGSSVTISGTNFSTTAANNIVKFNGTVATITGTPTATSIVATVPTGASTGVITVEVNGQTATSATSFTVIPVSELPTIASFNPTSGAIGTSVTITGTNFSTTAGNNIVRFNGALATVTGTPTATSIVTAVPIGATTGKITVQVAGQTATSATDFTITTVTLVQITNVTFPASFTRGSSLSVSITVNDASKVTSVSLVTRGISEAVSAAKSTSVIGAGNKFDKVIEAADLADPIGLVYFYEVVDLNGVKISSAITNAYPILSSTSTEQVLPGLSFGSEVSDYQIIAFPFAFNNNAATSVLNALGTYDKTKWRLFDFVGGDNREYPAFTSIDPGKGYWLIVRNTITINPGAGQTVAVGSTPFSIPIVAGWNLIGNPYNFKVSWDDIRAANTDISGLDDKVQVFSGGRLTEVSVIDKFRGGFIFSNSAGSLKIPVTRNTTLGRIKETESGRFALDQPYWEVPLMLTDGALANELGGIGMNPGASLLGKDQYDNVSVPLPDGLTLFELAAAHPEVHATFSRDVVPTTENFKWKFEVKGAKGKQVVLRWDNSYFGNNEKELVLFDPSTLQLIDMRTTDHLSLTDRMSEITILFGSRDFIEQQLDDQLPVLGTPFPVPAHSEVTIPFRVPLSSGVADVKIRVYDAKGVLVDTPVDKVMAPGHYEVKCQPHSGTGLYIVRMEIAGAPSQPVKIIIN